MIVVVLVIILIVVRYVSNSGSQVQEQGNIVQFQVQVEFVKSNFISRNVWNDNYIVIWGDNGNKIFVIKLDSFIFLVNVMVIYVDIYKLVISNDLIFKKVYDNCMVGDEKYCYILIDFG